MQGAGLVFGPLLALGLLATGMSDNLVWRLLLGFGAIPALAVFWLRRQINETPRFRLAQIEAREADEKARLEGKATGSAACWPTGGCCPSPKGKAWKHSPVTTHSRPAPPSSASPKAAACAPRPRNVLCYQRDQPICF